MGAVDCFLSGASEAPRVPTTVKETREYLLSASGFLFSGSQTMQPSHPSRGFMRCHIFDPHFLF